ncbi:MAG: hypothetical protein SOY07_09705 [Bacteroidales bacterium]|nr:hypothetical protein [Bacteroidales bacterium]
MKTTYRLMAVAMATLLTTACTTRPTATEEAGRIPNIWPDYADVTIPAGIAPLNFEVDSADAVFVTVRGEKGGEICASGKIADFDIDEWHDLTAKNAGADLSVSVCAKHDGKWLQYTDFKIHVSQDQLDDYGLTYRKIAPGYETYSHIGIYQRDIHTFDESPIVTSTLVPGQCMCCHTANRANPAQLTQHYRGKHPATLVQIDGQRKWLTTKTDSTLCNCMYPYWHPSGNYCAYSLNKVGQSFMTGHEKFIEVFDRASDCCVMDVRTNELILSPLLQTPDMETYPVFSSDGKTMFYCTSKPHRVPAEANQLRYDLCAIGFDAERGVIGNHVDTILRVTDKGHSISLPRPSYDGRFLMYCLTDYGYFPIDHKEADLWILDLRTGDTHPATVANSDDTESFHNWSSDSRWIVFSSRRHDSMTSLAYIAHVDTSGQVGKPFLLPQREPRSFYTHSLHSYNTPDFTTTKVTLDPRAAHRELFSDERIQVTIKK